MMMGEFLCLGAYGLKIFLKNKDIIVEKKEKINPILLALPASLDLISTILMNISLTFIAASVY